MGLVNLLSSLCEHDDGSCQTFVGCLHGCYGNGEGGATGKFHRPGQLLKLLSVEHGRLCLAGDLGIKMRNYKQS